ncbi:nucleotide exchange factor GrpE [Streptacidiphilus carbonis]|uniref:nucleotide exchange factor GrpE n=1 Tax=Streptacidiphilus carbonis TaxID=105422 RepID=UPI0005AB8967|nr:nucleotide exchange factor GrpE [Streptacidiphilus carbonis]
MTDTDTDTDPLAITEDFLPVPERALDVDLADAFTKLLFRSSVSRRRREEDARTAESAQRGLLLGLLEVDDVLYAVQEKQAQLPPGIPRPDNLVEMAAAVQAVLRKKLAVAEVAPMRLMNYIAHPAVADIVGRVPSADKPDETVVSVVRNGFNWRGDVLRRAEVEVAVPWTGAEPLPAPTEPAAAPTAEPASETAPAPELVPERKAPPAPRPRKQPAARKPRKARSPRKRK